MPHVKDVSMTDKLADQQYCTFCTVGNPKQYQSKLLISSEK